MRYSVPLFFLCVLLSASCAHSGADRTDPPATTPGYQAVIQAPRATATEREAFARKMRGETIGAAFAGELNDATEAQWQGAFWASNLMLERTETTRSGIARALADAPRRSPGFQRAALESAYTLFPEEFTEKMRGLLNEVEGPKNFAMAAYYILRDDPSSATVAQIRAAMGTRFPQWSDDPVLAMLAARMDVSPARRVAERPPLETLLAAPLLEGHPAIFSFQRVDRRQPGLAVIRGADGRFVRNADGGIFAVPHLALAVSNLPGTITNGNSPQGILSIRGAGNSRNVFIGPSPTLISRLPVEASVPDFFLDDARTGEWTPEVYDALLPADWRAYLPIHEAWYAGRAGRSEIILHGTTINPEFYAGEPYYPMTPSLGCLTTTELWSLEDGSLLRSDQIRLWEAWRPLGDRNGTLVVVEIDDTQRPVMLEDIEDAIKAAEALRVP